MNAELSAAVGFTVAAAASWVATPLAIVVARRTDFYDHPREYRRHSAATPFLGGAAVLAGFLAAAVAVGAVNGGLLVLISCAVGLWLLGTLDDRITLSPKWRLLAETIAAVALISAGLGWKTMGSDGIGDLVSVIWIVGLVNAFNLMDNLDGASGTVACVSAAGIGTLAAIYGQVALAGLAFGLAGACLAFLRWNLAGPAKIFLGDGGSMPVGFLVAALAMATGSHLRVGDANLLAGGLIVGLPILDTALVTYSRTRRRVPLVTGGRDHLTHRLLLVLHTPRAVAAALACVQATLCALAIAADDSGPTMLGAIAIGAVSFGLIAIVTLDLARWRPAGIAVGGRQLRREARRRSIGVDSG